MKAQAIQEDLTQKFIAAIEQGVADPNGWRKPWSTMVFDGRNAFTQTPYRGFNSLALAWVSQDRNYESGEWATFNQWKGDGKSIREGETATHLIRWVQEQEKDDDDGKQHRRSSRKMFPVGFSVFAAEQTVGYTPKPVVPLQRQQAAEKILRAVQDNGVTILWRSSKEAFYSPDYDTITLPELSQFKGDANAYYATALHESGHATAHPKRLNREFGKRFGDEKYAMEELTAELAAAILGTRAGVTDEQQTAQHGNYLANWLRVLKSDPSALLTVSSAAGKAADWWISRAFEQEMTKSAMGAEAGIGIGF